MRSLLCTFKQFRTVEKKLDTLRDGLWCCLDTPDKMQKRIEFDLHYIRNWSIILDIKIIFLTCFKGFFNKNAY